MRNISIIRNYNELQKEYNDLLKRIDKVLTIIEKEGRNKGWEIEKKMPEFMVEQQIQTIYEIEQINDQDLSVIYPGQTIKIKVESESK